MTYTHSCLIKSFRLLTLSLLGILLNAAAQAQSDKPQTQSTDRELIYSVDSSATLISRVQPTSTTVLEMFRDAGMSPTEHHLSEAEQQKVADAFAALPALHQRILKSHLRSINFLDNMPNTALTSTVNPEQTHKLFDITFRAEILHQDVSEWLTQKELTCFDTTKSPIRVSIQAGNLSAFEYVLLHEATHVVDGSLGITPISIPAKGQTLPDSLKTDFIAGVWVGHTVAASDYKSSLLDSLAFRRGGKPVPVAKAKQVYQALKQMPFVSLYSRNSWNEDLAEYVTLFHFTQKRKQPFVITIYNGNQLLFSYKPLQSALVRKRFKYMSRFYQMG